MRWTWMAALILGCDAKDPAADWDEWDTAGYGHEEHADHDADADVGEESGGEEWGGEETGGEETGWGEETGGETGAESGGSCSFGDIICIEPNETNNVDWCDGVGGTYSADSCPAWFDGSCELPAGGDYTAPATAYYYGFSNGEDACADAGGVYTAVGGGEETGGEETGAEETGGEETGGEETGAEYDGWGGEEEGL